MSKKYYLWTQDHIRLKKVIEAHGVDYLIDELCQTTIKMINTLQDITTIKPLNQYEMLITLKNSKKAILSQRQERNQV